MKALYRATAVIVTFALAPLASAVAAKPAPDLVIRSVAMPPATTAPGTSFAVAARTLNRGGSRAVRSTTRYYLSLNSTLNRGDILLAGHAVPRLGQGRGFSKRAMLHVPGFVQPGLYRLLVCADRRGRVSERDERNNCAIAPRRIRVVPRALLGPGPASGKSTALVVTPGDQGFVAALGSSSPAVGFTVTNSGKESSGKLRTLVTGAHASRFKAAADSCAGSTLAAGASCTVDLTFSPQSLGAKSASLQVSGAPGGIASVALTGTGQTGASLSITPADQAFGAVPLGSTGAPVTFTVTNSGQASSGPIVTSVTGTDASQFTPSANGCAGTVLAGDASCTIALSLSPSGAKGARAATLTVSGSPGGSAGSNLSGTAITPAKLTASPGDQQFGSVSSGSTSGALTFTIVNTGEETSGVPSATVTGADASQFVISNNTCAAPLSLNGTCDLKITFLPTGTAGPRSAALAVQGTPGGTHTTTLGGTADPPALTISPTSQQFGDVVSGASSGAFQFTVTNTGLLSTTLSTTLGTAGASQFAISSNTCAGTLGAGANCTLWVTFKPTSAGAKSAALQAAGSPGGTVSAALGGTGTPPPPAALSMTPPDRDFGTVASGASGSTFQFTVTNTGGSPTTALNVTRPGAHGSQFPIGANSCQGATLGPGLTCTMTLGFAPTGTPGARTASLQVSATQGGTVTSGLTGSAG